MATEYRIRINSPWLGDGGADQSRCFFDSHTGGPALVDYICANLSSWCADNMLVVAFGEQSMVEPGGDDVTDSPTAVALWIAEAVTTP